MKKSEHPAAKRSVSFNLPSSKVIKTKSLPYDNNNCNSLGKYTPPTSRVKFKENSSETVRDSERVQYVRNTHLPIKKAHSIVSLNSSLNKKCFKSDDMKEASATSIQNNSRSNFKDGCKNFRLDVPELCTSLNVANKLLEEATAETRSIDNEDIFRKEILKNKVLRKINIPFEEYIYKNLVDLKVSEDDVCIYQEKKNKRKNFERTKDEEPKLSDFYNPSFNQEYLLKIDKPKLEFDCQVYYNGFSLLDRIKNWEIL